MWYHPLCLYLGDSKLVMVEQRVKTKTAGNRQVDQHSVGMMFLNKWGEKAELFYFNYRLFGA